MLELVKNVDVILPSGQTVKCDVEVHGRKGSLSGNTWIILYNDRRIVPFEQRIKGYQFTQMSALQIIYSGSIKDLVDIYSDNPLIGLIPNKKDEFRANYFYSPIELTEKHGFSFKKK